MSDIINAPSYERRFLPKDLKVVTWKDVEPFAGDLLARSWKDAAEYRGWLEQWDELDIVMSERGSRLYIEKSCDTENEALQKAYLTWVTDVSPPYSVFSNDMNKKFMESTFNDAINEEGFVLLLKRSKAALELFREENVALHALDAEMGNEYGEVAGAQMVELDGKAMTLSQAGTRLESADRDTREKAWHVIAERRLQDKEKLDDIFARMVANRHQIALNADEKNYRDYKFKEYQRFDYTPQDCFQFHQAIEKAVMPIAAKMDDKRRRDMGLEKLRPWDFNCDSLGRPAIIAFQNSDELIEKSIRMLDQTMPIAADTLRRMQSKNLLDLDSRKGKEPGGYNSGLPETRSSFMFTNQSGTVRDMETVIHEAGHATHDMLSSNLGLNGYRQYPMELAEVASMSLELLTHDQWPIFFDDPEILKRAQHKHLSSIIQFFPMMASIDAFQHAVYENPDISPSDRHDVWDNLQKRFGNEAIIDCSGINPDYRRTGWQRVLHIYAVPFYYVEYGIAQLGALQLWRKYKKDKQDGIRAYQNILSLGYTKSIPEIYQAGGIKFDFSVETIAELMDFVGEEMEKLI